MEWNLSVRPKMKITAIGLGRFGGQIAAIEYFAKLGAKVLVTDSSSPELLTDSIAKLEKYDNVCFCFGEHGTEDFIDADLILASPAVKPGHHCLQAAIKSDVPIVTEMELFLNNCLGKIVAISGTVGKSTTATMIKHLLNRLGLRGWLGGNIGKSLLPDVQKIKADDWVIVELSSFQLHWLSRNKWRYEIAVLTNYSPHHLAWHQNEASYRACKESLFRDQGVSQLAVLPSEFQGDNSWSTAAATVYCGKGHSIGFPNSWAEHQKRNGEAAIVVVDAICERSEVEVSRNQLVSLLSDYQGLRHRMERILEKQERRFINDSKATSPQATIAAIRSLNQKTWLIVGGAVIEDDLTELISELTSCPFLQGIACVGVTGKKIAHLLIQKKCVTNCQCFPQLQQAVLWSWENSQQGDTIFLSPCCPSYDEFKNYEHRGNQFAKYAEEL